MHASRMCGRYLSIQDFITIWMIEWALLKWEHITAIAANLNCTLSFGFQLNAMRTHNSDSSKPELHTFQLSALHITQLPDSPWCQSDLLSLWSTPIQIDGLNEFLSLSIPNWQSESFSAWRKVLSVCCVAALQACEAAEAPCKKQGRGTLSQTTESWLGMIECRVSQSVIHQFLCEYQYW